MASVTRGSRGARRKVLSSRRFPPALWRQFAIFTVLPTLVTVAGLGWVALYAPPSAFDIAMLLTMWALTGGLGISVGFHRLLTHKSFKTHPATETSKHFSANTLLELGDRGLMGMFIPKAYGGLELSTSAAMKVFEQTAAIGFTCLAGWTKDRARSR